MAISISLQALFLVLSVGIGRAAQGQLIGCLNARWIRCRSGAGIGPKNRTEMVFSDRSTKHFTKYCCNIALSAYAGGISSLPIVQVGHAYRLWRAPVSRCCPCRRKRFGSVCGLCFSPGPRDGGGAARDAEGCTARFRRGWTESRERTSRCACRKGTGGKVSDEHRVNSGGRGDGTSERRRRRT